MGNNDPGLIGSTADGQSTTVLAAIGLRQQLQAQAPNQMPQREEEQLRQTLGRLRAAGEGAGKENRDPPPRMGNRTLAEVFSCFSEPTNRTVAWPCPAAPELPTAPLALLPPPPHAAPPKPAGR